MLGCIAGFPDNRMTYAAGFCIYGGILNALVTRALSVRIEVERDCVFERT